jgi:hypothetical protein
MFFKIHNSRGAVLFRCVFDTSDQERVSFVRLSLPAPRENQAVKALAWVLKPLEKLCRPVRASREQACHGTNRPVRAYLWIRRWPWQ